jgi:hypothetical protein
MHPLVKAHDVQCQLYMTVVQPLMPLMPMMMMVMSMSYSRLFLAVLLLLDHTAAEYD